MPSRIESQELKELVFNAIREINIRDHRGADMLSIQVQTKLDPNSIKICLARLNPVATRDAMQAKQRPAGYYWAVTRADVCVYNTVCSLTREKEFTETAEILAARNIVAENFSREEVMCSLRVLFYRGEVTARVLRGTGRTDAEEIIEFSEIRPVSGRL